MPHHHDQDHNQDHDQDREHKRCHPILALLAGIVLVGTLLLAFDETEEAQISQRMLESSTLKDLAGLDENSRQDECIQIMRQAHIKKKKKQPQTSARVTWGKATEKQKLQWQALDCVHVLSLYKPKVLGYNDTLPEEIYQSPMSLEHQKVTFKMAKALVDHLNSRAIRFSPGFGTLLGIVRHGVAVVPWDDDVDFLVDNREKDFKKKMTKGLEKVKRSKVKGSHWRITGAWSLPGGYVLFSKEKGIWKVQPKGKRYPTIDLFPFKKKTGAPEINSLMKKYTLNFGHVHKFAKPDVWFGKMTETISVPFSTDIPDLIEFPLPDDALAVVTDDYGKSSLTQCKVSFIHNKGCKRGSKTACRNALASRLAHLNFPCVLLPGKFHGMTLANEEGYRGKAITS